MNKNDNSFVKIWLTILTVLLILGYVLSFFMCLGMNKVYADDVEIVEIIEEEIPKSVKMPSGCYIGEIEYDETEEIYVEEEPAYVIDVTDEDIDLMARVVMSESSVLDFDAKVAVACVIINRVKSDYYEMGEMNTVSEVVSWPNALSTQDNGEPTLDCYNAVMHALKNENIFPDDMMWFCYGFTSPYGCYYTEIDGMIFNTVSDHNL